LHSIGNLSDCLVSNPTSVLKYLPREGLISTVRPAPSYFPDRIQTIDFINHSAYTTYDTANFKGEFKV
jgi:hypothetical protein